MTNSLTVLGGLPIMDIDVGVEALIKKSWLWMLPPYRPEGGGYRDLPYYPQSGNQKHNQIQPPNGCHLIVIVSRILWLKCRWK